jgi:hypothetical protein
VAVVVEPVAELDVSRSRKKNLMRKWLITLLMHQVRMAVQFKPAMVMRWMQTFR